MTGEAVVPEFSRPLDLDAPDLKASGDEEVRFDIEAKEAERAALAQRFGLIGLEALSASLRVRRPAGKPYVRISGRLTARVTQACVVTLAPVAGTIQEDFAVMYSLAPLPVPIRGEVLVSPDDEDLEPVPPGGIDLGEIAAEQLSLALDPYPRAEGAELERGAWGGAEEEERPKPFAGLAALRKDKP